MTSNQQGIVDTLDFDRVIEMADRPGPKVTLYVPTEVRGTTADRSATVLANHLRTAAAGLVEAGMTEAEAEAVLAPIRDFTTDSSYWRRQSRGLVAFAAQGFHQVTRIPIEVGSSVIVADQFHLVPLAPLLESTGKTYVLALSKNSVRLFDATRNSIEQLPQGRIPRNFEEVVDELPEHQLQQRSVGVGRAAFHGHSGADETNRVLTEKFLRAVGEAVGATLGTARSQPLVLASVTEYLPVFREVCPYPVIHDEVIAGNPEHATPDELRSKAWQLLADRSAAQQEDETERALSRVHNDRGSFDLGQIARAADQGRVDTMYLPRDGRRRGSPAQSSLADDALVATLRTRGSVRTLEPWQWPAEAIATFRH